MIEEKKIGTEIPGGVTAAAGFQAAGVRAAIKSKKPDKKDVALIYTKEEASIAGVFTQNQYAAAPVGWCRQVVKGGKGYAIIANSGNANACTGAQGEEDARAMAVQTGEKLGVSAEKVLVASTGVIGVELPMDRISAGIDMVVEALSTDGGQDAALAIMTTDTFPKEYAIQCEIGGKTITIGGIAKGSGMIHPNMATMLGFITTDAAVAPVALQQALKAAADVSFNMVTVDGDTSTNDSLMVMANGVAGNEEIVAGTSDYAVFAAALRQVCTALARMIAKDGEGATKLLTIQALHMQTEADAKKAAKAVAASSLVKAAFFGEDANWGRIICAVGYSEANYDPKKVSIWLESKAGKEQVMAAGAPYPFSEERAAQILAEDEITVTMDFADGEASATAWGCDLSYDYVKINGDYRT